MDCEVSIEPEGTYRRKLLLNSWLASWPEGTYHVVVSIVGGFEASTNVEIEPRDPIRLSNVCRDLERSAHSAVADESLTASKALRFAVDEACLPSFKRMLQKLSLSKRAAIQGLAQLGTAEALGILVEVWEELYPSERSLAVFELSANDHLEAFDAALAKAGLLRGE